MSIFQECPKCGLSTSEGGATCELCVEEAQQKELDDLREENARLRESLQSIAKTERDEDNWTREQLITALRYCENEARTALGEK